MPGYYSGSIAQEQTLSNCDKLAFPRTSLPPFGEGLSLLFTFVIKLGSLLVVRLSLGMDFP